VKHILNLLKSGLLGLLPFLAKAKIVAGAGGVISLAFPAVGALLGGNVLAGAGVALYWLELLVRIVPTAGAYTPLTVLIQVLQAILPNQAATVDGSPAEHVQGSFLRRIFSHSAPTPEPVAAPDFAGLQSQVAALVAAQALTSNPAPNGLAG
jgi:hypothetical protein